ncbi:MAG TPA: hypothetical protein VES97_12395 [Solirubrobacteraceae bacterium]|nr:hypothetical protein [Solirubrobacteraceae bacterium]
MAVVVITGALVASAATAAGAAAAEPAFFECAKVTSGDFASKSCSEGGLHGAGKFELREGIGRKHRFTAKTREIELSSEAFEMHCEKTTMSGEDTSPTTVATVFMTMNRCEEVGTLAPCTSSGEKQGVVVLGPMSGSLGYVSRENKEVGVDLAGEGGAPLSEFGCNRSGLAEYQLKGSIIGLRKGGIDAIAKSFSLTFGVPRFEGGELDVPVLLDLGTGEEEEATFGGAKLKASGEKLEIKA